MIRRTFLGSVAALFSLGAERLKADSPAELQTGESPGPGWVKTTETGGRLSEILDESGTQYITLPRDAFDDGGERDRSGCPLYLQQQDNSHVLLMVVYWRLEGDIIVVAEKGSVDVVAGSRWKIGSVPGHDFLHCPETPLLRNYVYCPWVSSP